MQWPDTRAKLNVLGVEGAGNAPAVFGAFMTSGYGKLGRAIEAANGRRQ